MAAILKTFAGLNFYTRTCFIDFYHISFKKSHQTLRPRSCRVNQNFDISWILDLGLYCHDADHMYTENSLRIFIDNHFPPKIAILHFLPQKFCFIIHIIEFDAKLKIWY